MDFPLFVSFVLLFGRQSSISVILTTGRVSPRLWLYWVCTIWAVEYDKKVKVKVKVKVKSGFSLFFSISLFQKRQARTRSARRQWICVKKLLKIPKATHGTWVANFYGVVITQLTANWRTLILVPRASILLPPLTKRIEDVGTRMKESGREKKRFHARG